MKRLFLSILFLLVVSITTNAQTYSKLQGWCTKPATNVTTVGLVSSTKFAQNCPSCQVTVYLTGTLTLATIYSDSIGTPKANPFTADASSSLWAFYYTPGTGFDIRFANGSTTCIGTPYTLTDVAAATAVNSINSQTGSITIALGTTGTDANIVSGSSIITINLPTASASNRGLLSAANWTTFNAKIGGSGTSGYFPKFTASGTIGNSQLQDDGALNIFFSNQASVGANEISARGYGSDSAIYGQLSVYKSRGTIASPTNPQSGDTLGRLNFKGFGSGTNYLGGALIYAFAAENWTASNRGTDLYLGVAKKNNGGFFDRIRILSEGSIEYPGETSGYIRFNTPAIAPSVTYTWPSSTPTLNYVMSATAVSGSDVTLGWVAQTGGISGLTTGKLPKAASSSTLSDSIITESSTKIGINQASPVSLLTNASSLASDPNAVTVDAASGFGWNISTTGYIGAFQNQANSTGARGLLVKTTNTNANSTPLSVVVGSVYRFVTDGAGRTHIGRNLGVDFSSGVSDLHVQSDGSTSGTFAAKFDNASSTVLSARNDGRVGVMTDAPSYELHVVGNTGMRHLIGTSNTPGIAAGAGAGTGPTLAISGNDLAMHMNITPGSTPSASAAVVTVTFATAFSAAPKVFCVPTNIAAALLTGTSQVFVDVGTTSTTTFQLVVGSAALVQSTLYKFSCTAIQ